MRPVVVGTPGAVSALRLRFAVECALLAASEPDEIERRLESARGEGAEVLLVVVDSSCERLDEAVAKIAALAPGAAIVCAGELPSPPSPATLFVPATGEGLEELTTLLLDRLRLERRSVEAQRRLELVSSTGVSMASSFDILAILERAHEAASEILGGGPVDLFYSGCPAINARPRWYPETPAGPLSAESRLRFAERSAIEAPERGMALPLEHQGERLGALVCEGPAQGGEDCERLLAMLALQAATALGNIHSAQERIQFERLSAIGRMIGSVVHDFRSPLTALRGYAGMLASLELDSRERREFTGALLEECDRLDHMVDELLQFTRGQRPAVDRVWTRLGPYLRKIQERARKHYGGGGIEVELAPGFDGDVLLDRQTFERALWNAITNGCQAMAAKGGALRMRALALEADRVAVEIEDEGEGIPEDIRHRVFEPFFSYGKSEGIGLGMATAKRIVEEHEGSIELRSRAGGGTVVRFVLPRNPRGEASEIAVPRAGRARD